MVVANADDQMAVSRGISLSTQITDVLPLAS